MSIFLVWTKLGLALCIRNSRITVLLLKDLTNTNSWRTAQFLTNLLVLPSSSSFLLPIPIRKQPVCFPETPAMADHEEVNEVEGDKEYVPEDSFTPVVTLPEVNTSAVDEDEELLGKVRAKVYRWGTGKEGVEEWRERGVGEVKFLKNKSTEYVRLLMRREQTLKICLNHFVSPTHKLAPNVGSEKSWVWVAKDYADGEGKVEKLAIRFNTVEHTKEFQTLFEQAKANNQALLEGKAKEQPADEAPASASTSASASASAADSNATTEKADEPKTESSE